MKLHALKRALRAHPERLVRVQLPDGSAVPASFHLTEVGQVSKVFIDCGGQVHSELRCILQTWVGRDADHRLPAGRFADILDLGRAVVASEEMEVEVEHGQVQATQYPLERWQLDGADHLVLALGHRATDCLARKRRVADAVSDADEPCGCQPQASDVHEAHSEHAHPTTACCI